MKIGFMMFLISSVEVLPVEDISCANGTYPNKIDKNSYYVCSNGIRYDQKCPLELVFNPCSAVCDWPQNSKKCQHYSFITFTDNAKSMDAL